MKKPLAFAATALLVLLGASQPQAITWGQPDGNEHPEVVAILFQRAEGFYSCSGTLLSPTVVLTAGHCTEDAEGNPNLATYVRNDPVIDFGHQKRRMVLGKQAGDIFDIVRDGWVGVRCFPQLKDSFYFVTAKRSDVHAGLIV